MKKRILLFTLVAGFAYVTLSSDIDGVGNQGYDCTGAETDLGNPVGCSAAGVSCHGTASSPTAGITVAIELDSAGIPTTHYKGGISYTIKLTGVNTTTTTNLSKFGFQLSAIKGSIALTSPVNAGTFASSGLPAGVQYLAAPGIPDFVVNIVEQTTQLSPSSGSGGTGTTYSESIPWTAPASGTGTISLWAALNAVNNNGTNDAGDLWNTNHAVISEWSTTSVANVLSNISLNAFPNPATTNLNLQLTGAEEGNYSLQVFDLTGRTITTENIAVTGNHFVTAINTANWTPGMYNVVLSKDGSTKAITVTKQ